MDDGDAMSAMSPSRCGHWGHRNKAGGLCGAVVFAGTTTCKRHAGKPPVLAKAEGQVRVELANWGTDDTYVDPGEQFLRLIAQSARRCDLYSSLLQDEYMDKQVAALVGVHYVVAADEDGDGPPKAVASGEYIRGLADLEARERAFCAKLCASAITAGIEARRVQLAAQQVDQLDTVLRTVLAALGHDPDSAEVRTVVHRQLQLTR